MKNATAFQALVILPVVSAIEKFSTKNAFCINGIFYTYHQFGEVVSKIRREVKELEKDNVYFGLIANDDLETYASIIALWLEGKAYVPLHPNQPFDRCEKIIKQTNLSTILDSSAYSVSLNCHIINTSSLSFTSNFLDYDSIINDDKDVYILFTSGSTGQPKGVQINRRNIGAFMESFWDSGIEISKEDKCLQCFDLTFDVSVQSFLAPLTRGACVFTVPHDQIKYSYVYGLLEDEGITFGAMTPSMLRYLQPYFGEIVITSMKYCILTGEASPLSLIKQWEKCIPNAEIFDFYGPTETTIYCTYYKIKRETENKSFNGMASIGHPMKNVETIIIDENHNILKQGEKGELCISGDQVSPGYWNNPEKNKTSFFEKVILGIPKRFYHTGDICYYDKDGCLMLIGRMDSQVKIQGYRVELGEIEFHAREFLSGNNAVVITSETSFGITELVLFVEEKNVNCSSLNDYLKSKLPFYMIPAKIISEIEFPLNSNGKVDKRNLKKRISCI